MYNEKQKKILEENFNVGVSKYSNGLYTSLEAWTNGGVDMYIEIEDNKSIIQGLEEYIENFDIDDEIDLYRQDKRYREAFRITESVKDFEDWIEFIKNVIKQLKEEE
jgi:hypothetical protein